jgi:hypothetical protein
MLENRVWCAEHIDVLEEAIRHRASVHGDISNHTELTSDTSIPKHSEDEIYELKIRQIREDYFRDIDDGMSEQHASAKKISAEKTALKPYKQQLRRQGTGDLLYVSGPFSQLPCVKMDRSQTL